MNLRQLSLLIILCLFFVPKAKAVTFTIEPQKSLCFYETITNQSKAHVDFQVVQGGKLDINFRIRNPNGHDVYNLRQTNEGSHNFITTLLGDYSFCFDNSFSAISTKEVNFNFKLYAVGRLRRRLGSDIDGNENDATTPDELNNLSQTLEKLSDNIGEVRELQMYLKAREMVHRNTSESTNSRVLWWSIFATVLIGSASVAQITYLRKIFANKRKV